MAKVKKFGCFLDRFQRNPSITFSNEPDAQKWCDGWNSKPADLNSLWGAMRIGKYAHVREIEVEEDSF